MTMSIIDFLKVWSWCAPLFLFSFIVSNRRCVYFAILTTFTPSASEIDIYALFVWCSAFNTLQLFKLGTNEQ